jgi:outer membrane protein assembly factor BamB
LAADWPQWLGPHRDGGSSEAVAPWKGPLKVLWRKPAGEGNSAPVVSAGQVFLHSKVQGKFEEEIRAFDANSGKTLWRTAYQRGNFSSPYGNGPRATPAVAGGKLYAHGISGILTCLDAANGNQLWQRDTWKEFQAPHPFFGASCSPLVDDKHVFLNVGGKGAGVVAFDKNSGEVLWKSLDDRASYSSPIVFGKGSDRQLVFLTQAGLVSLRPADGTVFWRHPFRDLLLESSTTPVRDCDLLLASSITIGSAGLRLDSHDGKPVPVPLWKNAALTSYFSTPVAVGEEHFFMVTGTNPLTALNPLAKPNSVATLHCVELRTGKSLWQKRGVGQYHASLLRTGDSKVLMLEEGGDLVLLDPDPKSYRELARSPVCGHTWAHPALAAGRLFVRDDNELICLQLGK